MVPVIVWIYKRKGYKQYRFFVMKVYESEISVRGNKRVNSFLELTNNHSNPDEVKKFYIQ